MYLMAETPPGCLLHQAQPGKYYTPTVLPIYKFSRRQERELLVFQPPSAAGVVKCVQFVDHILRNYLMRHV